MKNSVSLRGSSNHFYPVISSKEACRQGTPPSVLRTIARSLERIGRHGYAIKGFEGSDEAYDVRGCFHSARQLRQTARQMERR